MFSSFFKSKPTSAPAHNAMNNVYRLINEQVKLNLDELIGLRQKGIKNKNFGVVDEFKWFQSMSSFMNQKVLPRLTDQEKKALQTIDLKKLLQSSIDEAVKWEIQCREMKARWELNGASGLNKVMTPIEYEKYCANLIALQGWKITMTPTSGDQGADIIASKGGSKLVVQCKQYSSTVGNSAVQEVIAARAHFRANYGVVITNSTYTRSAKELAKSTGIILLNHDEISELNLRLKLINP